MAGGVDVADSPGDRVRVRADRGAGLVGEVATLLRQLVDANVGRQRLAAAGVHAEPHLETYLCSVSSLDLKLNKFNLTLW